MIEIITATGLNGLIVFIAYHFAKKYFSSYIDQKAKNLATLEDAQRIAAESERGKNLATKEDIGDITKRIEQVKTEHALLLEEARQRNSLRNAVIAERIQAHQEAYALWQSMRSVAHDPDCSAFIEEAEAWWRSKCLYLDSPAREHFRLALWATAHHKLALDERWDKDLIKQNWQSIERAGESIVTAASLPGLSSIERDNPVTPKEVKAVLRDVQESSVL